MKQISLFIVVLFMCLINLQAQTEISTGPSYSSLEKKLEKSNKTIEDPKKSTSAKTWLERATLFQDIAEVNVISLRLGMSAGEIKIFLKEPKEVKTDANGTELWVYDRVNLTIEKGTLKGWNEIQVINPNPLSESLICYNKAIQLDTLNKLTKKVGEGLVVLKELYHKKALNCYFLQDFKCASEAFVSKIAISEMKQVNIVDTTIIYFAGLTAYECKNYEVALIYFQRAIDLKYNEPALYTTLSKLYISNSDTAKALSTLKLGFSAFPEDVGILIEIINLYLSSNESVVALEYINKAKEKDPLNKSFYFVEGTLYDKVGNMDKSVESYKKAIEIDTSYVDSYFNLALVYYNNAVKLTDVANTETDNKKYLEKKVIADNEFAKAIPYMEKAYSISKSIATPESLVNVKSALDTLKQLYYRLKMTSQLERVTKLLKDLN